MNRLTIRTPKGAALKLDNPKTKKEAKKQLHDKYLMAIEKLAQYEDTGLTPEKIESLKSKQELIRPAQSRHTCKDCKHFIGAGDWNICCGLMPILCYRGTPACDLFEPLPDPYEEGEQG